MCSLQHIVLLGLLCVSFLTVPQIAASRSLRSTPTEEDRWSLHCQTTSCLRCPSAESEAGAPHCIGGWRQILTCDRTRVEGKEYEVVLRLPHKMTVMKSNEYRQVLARACEPDSQDLKAMGTIQEVHESMAETKDHDVEPVETQTVLPTTIEPEHANDGDDVHHAASSSQLDLEDDIGFISTIPVSHTTGPHAALQPASTAEEIAALALQPATTTEQGSSGLHLLLQRTRALLSARTLLIPNNEEETKVVEVNNQKLDEGRLGQAPLSLASFELFMLLVLGISLPIVHWRKMRVRYM